ncbi:HlyD family type I secretion periplasmic adaptor subunit [Cohaesibacter intestini]|uniref:HlyD family type I secretion periplasmic adaptor subunit n=1 Tax=Cohaesibacter intestini TaxID=2211145 RepID=UPI000DEAA8A3|nr:HlyD family type I secretion periplasmic adaptor subunit [Cohaesibacter intestini]
MTQSDATASRINQLERRLRLHFWFTAILCLCIFAGLMASATIFQISSAVVASGMVVVDGNTKRVQHREGGIVDTIWVSDGMEVEAGDPLIRLDDTLVQANLAIVQKQLLEQKAQLARLRAERDDAQAIDFSDIHKTLPDMWRKEWDDIEQSQTQLFIARRQSLEGRTKQLAEQINQLKSQTIGLERQVAAKEKELSLIHQNIEVNEGLHEKKLFTRSALNLLKREGAELEGEHGVLISQIAQVQQVIGEKEILALQVREEFRSQLLENYQQTRSKIAQLEEQEVSIRDALRRVEIKAPRKGIVHQLNIHTIGAVISPGEVIMMIVPKEEDLIIEARVNPRQIDRISPLQEARIRFPSFDQRTTPELNGKLQTVSADLVTDEKSGLSFYRVRLGIDETEVGKLEGKKLIPGMPAEVYLQTGDRSILSYLVKPLTDQIAHALRER